MSIEKIALFGGTFDPIHLGHLKMARVAQKELQLSQVIFIPNKKSPLKNQFPVVEPKNRLKMLELALKDDPQFFVSNYEVNKATIDYSYQTILYFKEKFPKSQLYWLLGADQVKQLHLWFEINKMSHLVHFVAGERNGIRNNNPLLPFKIEFLNFDPIEINATEVRKKINQKDYLKTKIPQVVMEYIMENKLYLKK